MASKRQKGEHGEGSSSSSRTYNRKKFVSPDAADKFDHILAERTLIPERGLRPYEQDGAMLAMIRTRGWDTFTDHPAPAVTAIVKEFFANAQDTPGCAVLVRGQTVIFSRVAINDYYNLRGYDNCQYAAFKPDYDQIMRDLCQPGTIWKRNKHNGKVKSFPFKSLSRYGKIWYAFLCAKLMPCTHMSDVTWDRAGLLYAIITGLDIDVGRVIEASIKKYLKGATSGGIPHPSLITGLCKRAGVKWGASEPLQAPTTLLDHNLIQRYHVWSGGISDPRGLGFIIAPQAPVQADEENPAAVAHEGSSNDMQALTRQLKQLNRKIDRIDRQNLRLAMRQGQMHTYNANFNRELLTCLARMNPDIGNIHITAPQPLPEYPPSYSDEEDSEDSDEEEDEADEDDPAD